MSSKLAGVREKETLASISLEPADSGTHYRDEK
jgi:hypothetical protein